MRLNNDLVEKLEVWGFEDGKLIFKDMSFGTVLELEPRDISCATDDLLNSLHSSTCDFLNGLPQGLSMQFIQSIERGSDKLLQKHQEQLSTQVSPLVGELLNSRINKLQKLDAKGELPKQKIYLTLRRAFVQKTERKGFKFWQKQESILTSAMLQSEIKQFDQSVESIRQGLDVIGVSSKILPEDDVFKLLFEQWNPGHPVDGLNFNKDDIRNDLILNDLILSTKGFMIGQVHHRLLSLKIMPEQTFASMAESMRELPFDSKLFLTIEVLNQDREDLALQTQRRIAYAMYAGKSGVSDLESAAKLQDIEAILARRVSGETKIFSMALNVLLRSVDESELDSQVEQVLQKFRELSGSEGMTESLAAAGIFFEIALPNARAKERSRRVNTEVLADFLPIFGDWAGHDKPRVLLRNRHNGLLGFDPFSPRLTNFNQIISGGSGAGKSYLTNLLIAQVIKEDPKIFILDLGGSYIRLTEHLGGQYIPIGADSSIAINPFDLSDTSIDAIDQKTKFMTSLVELMTKEDGATGIGKLERSEIEAMIKSILATEKEPRLSHLRERLLLSGEPALVRMGKILGPWCGDSPYGKFVDQKTNLKLDKRIVCFDLKGMEGHKDLQAVCLFLITDLIWREVQKDRTTSKFVVFDECWSLLENDAGARFLGEVFRTFRKYRASAIAISQTMDDFANSKVAASILPNASVKWLLKQTGGNLPSLQKLLRTNEREMKLLESVQSKKGYFSEAFLIAGDDKQVVVVEGTPLEYWLATTDPADLKQLEKIKLEKPEVDHLEHLKLLSKRFPRGASVSI